MRARTIIGSVGALVALAPATPAGGASGGDVEARRLNVVAGEHALVRGRVDAPLAGRRVALERRREGRWSAIGGARAAADGRFSVRLRPRVAGSAHVRVRVGEWTRRVGRLNVYRRAPASWYGPGLYGERLGCGGRLTEATEGVAHRSLPCGTQVTLRHRGRTVRVPVVDCGPYAGGREFDLTAATRRALRFADVGTVLVAR